MFIYYFTYARRPMSEILAHLSDAHVRAPATPHPEQLIPSIVPYA